MPSSLESNSACNIVNSNTSDSGMIVILGPSLVNCKCRFLKKVDIYFTAYGCNRLPTLWRKIGLAKYGCDFSNAGASNFVPKKCRTDMSRKAGRVWSDGSLTDSSSSSSSSNESSMTSPILFRIPFYSARVFEKQPVTKTLRKSPAQQTGCGSSDSLSQRRCTHCQVQKTPQWRNGPLGPKTLCNACGVRFKSGWLFPEYRPTCSPTFSGDVHSNSHRKVLELRKKEKEVEPFLNVAVQ